MELSLDSTTFSTGWCETPPAEQHFRSVQQHLHNPSTLELAHCRGTQPYLLSSILPFTISSGHPCCLLGRTEDDSKDVTSPCSGCRAGTSTMANCWGRAFHSLLGCANPSQHSQDNTGCEVYLNFSASQLLPRQQPRELSSPAAVFHPASHGQALEAP